MESSHERPYGNFTTSYPFTPSQDDQASAAGVLIPPKGPELITSTSKATTAAAGVLRTPSRPQTTVSGMPGTTMAVVGVLNTPTPQTSVSWPGTTATRTAMVLAAPKIMASMPETSIERPLTYGLMTQETGSTTYSGKPPVTNTIPQYFFYANALLIVSRLFSLFSIYLSTVLLDRPYAVTILVIFLLALYYIYPTLTGIFTLIFGPIFYHRDLLSKPTKKFLKTSFSFSP